MYSQIDSNKRRSVVLIGLVTALLLGLGYIFSAAYEDTSYSMLWIALVLSLVSTYVSYFHGDAIALASCGATPISESEDKYVYRLVENLCITAGLPVPKIYLIDDEAINAFATGRKPELASIAITAGAIEKLIKEELEGVIAHELSHVQNYDIQFMTLVAVLVGSISIMANLFLRSRYWFGGSRRSNDKEGNNIAAVFMLVGVALAILTPIIAELIKLAVSRKREYLADASGSLLTRYPDGLAGALEKIQQESLPTTHASSATAHLYLANPFQGKTFMNLFSTHPPIEDRIKRLREVTSKA
jgi:heat shock protein HtpX